jgi:type II secretory pathway pseudopilin PulG
MMWQKQRKAFSMITAIFVIVLMATVAAFIMNISGKMVKETTVQYQREQAMLLAKSYMQYAVLAVTGNEHNGTNCLDNISGNYGGADGYNIDVNISYIGDATNLVGNCARELDNTVITPKSPLNIVVDVFVRYPDFDHPNDLNMTYHDRRLMKI